LPLLCPPVESSTDLLLVLHDASHKETLMKRLSDSCDLSGWNRLSAALFALATLSMGGCATKYLSVVAEPEDALVSVRTADGESLARSEAQPIKVEYSNELIVNVDPPAAQPNNWDPQKRILRQGDYERLPLIGKDTRQLKFELNKREFAEFPDVLIVLDPERQFRGLVTKTRAYFDTAEAGGAAPRWIVDFKGNLGVQGLSLSPAGDRIVFSEASFDKSINFADADHQPMVNLKGANLRALSINGGGIQQITSEDFRDMYPSFTADGKDLLISSNRRRKNFADLLLISATDRGGVANVYVDPRNALALRPSQAADETIAFAYFPEAENNQRAEVWTIGGVNRFPTQIAKGSQPMISPTGDRIAYIGPDGNLWVTNITGANQVQLTSGSGEILKRYEESLNDEERAAYEQHQRNAPGQSVMPYSYPSWSSDGQYILYTAMEGSDSTGRPNEDVWIMKHNGAGKQQLTTNGSADRYPMMSPDMKSIYFMSNRGGHWGIWSIAAPTTIAPVRASAPARATSPAGGN
jgi:hypothetical protein